MKYFCGSVMFSHSILYEKLLFISSSSQYTTALFLYFRTAEVPDLPSSTHVLFYLFFIYIYTYI